MMKADSMAAVRTFETHTSGGFRAPSGSPDGAAGIFPGGGIFLPALPGDGMIVASPT
jgi:hypothetical protein